MSAVPNRTPEVATSVVKFHASLNVSNLERSIDFYSRLLDAQPVKLFADYAKFEVEIPPMVLSLKPKRASAGGPLNHLGLRVVTLEQFEAIRERLEVGGYRLGRQDDVQCCYARQTKFWVTDPDDTMWEVYVLHADLEIWGEKDKKKLLGAPLRALGFRGMIRRSFANLFGKQSPKNCPMPTADASKIPVESTITPTGV